MEEMTGSERSGYNVRQPGAFDAYIPRPLPPVPPLDLSRLVAVLSAADQSLGWLFGATRHLPDQDLFLGMYVRREALLSSQIEGTDCTLDDLFAYELDGDKAELATLDVQEVVNYVAALNYGLERLDSLPISSRLIREVHALLLSRGRGSDKTPGEFRTTQNWIGPPGSTIATAKFVPPPVVDMEQAISDLEKFIHEARNANSLPALILCGLVHAQFETIHPFLDGNGRIGRLLITLILCDGRRGTAVLYLSNYLRRHRSRYFDLLTAVRITGAWEEWLEFFLAGIEQTASDAASTAQRVHELRENTRKSLEEAGASAKELAMLDGLFRQPLVNGKWVEKTVGVTAMTANAYLRRFVEVGALREITGRARNRVYRFDPYLDLFDQPVTEDVDDVTNS
jgi:Fic family protein